MPPNPRLRSCYNFALPSPSIPMNPLSPPRPSTPPYPPPLGRWRGPWASSLRGRPGSTTLFGYHEQPNTVCTENIKSVKRTGYLLLNTEVCGSVSCSHCLLEYTKTNNRRVLSAWDYHLPSLSLPECPADYKCFLEVEVTVGVQKARRVHQNN